ncbi:MAG TPA: hypothetical protein VN317_02700, partial [Candidatus Methanoperedens sp.]|nr:hypothetical protein [Candidatus Methanoperedens sp.]
DDDEIVDADHRDNQADREDCSLIHVQPRPGGSTNRVVPARVEGMAFRKSPQSESPAADDTVSFN